MIAPDTTKISIIFADDTVGIMSFVTCEYNPDDTVRWELEATEENIQAEIDKCSFPDEKLPIQSWRIVGEEEDISFDRDFRGSYRDNGTAITPNMAAARVIHLDALRAERTGLLVIKDGEWMREFGQGNTAAAEAIEAERQNLRDLPDVSGATTLAELKVITLNI